MSYYNIARRVMLIRFAPPFMYYSKGALKDRRFLHA
nr:MAG TPA: hypothetical protein [Caudoviricetes sp.]DAG60664.1 MAG TPA: hypothetical protein [Caudoviricetes sp.]